MSHLVQRKTSVNKQAVADKPKTNVMELQVPVAKNDDDEKDEPGAIIGDGGESFGITEGEDEGQRAELKEWMVEKVKLPQYYDVFVANGYETLDIVQDIADVNELKEIGITLKGHTLKLIKEVKRLKALNSFEDTIE
eukprot:343620_1